MLHRVSSCNLWTYREQIHQTVIDTLRRGRFFDKVRTHTSACRGRSCPHRCASARRWVAGAWRINTVRQDRAVGSVPLTILRTVRSQLRYGHRYLGASIRRERSPKSNRPRCESSPQPGVVLLVVTVYLSTAVYHFSTTFWFDGVFVLVCTRWNVAYLRILGY